MSVRRRAIRDRVERAQRLQAGCDEQKRIVEALLAMCERKRAAGETQVSIDDINGCFYPTVTAEPHGS